jgi:hypothetical protein
VRNDANNSVSSTKGKVQLSSPAQGLRLPNNRHALPFVSTNASLIRTSDAFIRINASFVRTNASFLRTSQLTRPQSLSPFVSTNASLMRMNDAFMRIFATDLFSNGYLLSSPSTPANPLKTSHRLFQPETIRNPIRTLHPAPIRVPHSGAHAFRALGRGSSSHPMPSSRHNPEFQSCLQLMRTNASFIRTNASFVLTNASFVRTSQLTRLQSSSSFVSTNASLMRVNDAFMRIFATDLFSNGYLLSSPSTPANPLKTSHRLFSLRGFPSRPPRSAQRQPVTCTP